MQLPSDSAGEMMPSYTDEAQIRELIDDWQSALSARDLDRLMINYDPDVVFYDAVPPFQHRGAVAYRATWEAMFKFLPPNIRSEIRDLDLQVSGDLATMFCLQQLTNADTGTPATCGWVRVTVCYRREQETWRVIHEHVSVPFDPTTGQAVFNREP